MCNKDNKYFLKVPLSPESDGEVLTIGVETDAAFIERNISRFRLGGIKNNDSNVPLLLAKLNELRITHSPEWLTEQYDEMELRRQQYEKDIEERAKANKLTALEKISMARRTHYVTYAIIGCNVLVYLLLFITGNGFLEFDTAALIKWGGNVKLLTVGGEWYRLITSTFLHAGLVHIAFNMYALLYIGIYLEPLLGKWRYLTVYLACGMLASLASTWWSSGTGGVSIGASGAIFGLYGVFLTLLTTNYVEKRFRIPMLRSICFFVVFNLVYGSFGNIDNAAHIGGLVSGILFGYLYYYIFISKKDNIIASLAITAVLTFALVYFVLPAIT